MTLCQCGCGQPAPIAKLTNRLYGWKAGEPVRFIAGHNARLQIRTQGYPMARVPDHPRASSNGYVLEHVLIAERAVGKPLPAGVEIHHVDENKLNNAPSNLVVCQNREYHDLLHVRTRVLRAGGNPNTQRLCSFCKQPRDFARFSRSKRNKNGGVATICRACAKVRWAAYYQLRRTA